MLLCYNVSVDFFLIFLYRSHRKWGDKSEKFGTTDRQRKSVLSCKTCLCCTLEKKECRQDKRISGKFLLETGWRKINLNSHSWYWLKKYIKKHRWKTPTSSNGGRLFQFQKLQKPQPNVFVRSSFWLQYTITIPVGALFGIQRNGFAV